MYASATLGPVLGFGAGAALMEVYVDFATPSVNHLELSPTDSQWVGAWWVGFLIFGALMILTAPPFFAFPKSLPEPSKIIAYDIDLKVDSSADSRGLNNSQINDFISRGKQTNQSSKSTQPSKWTSIKREYQM